MKYLSLLVFFIFSSNSYAVNEWLKNLDAPDKQQQLELRWKAFGGEADLRFMYEKLSINKISVNPEPQFPDKHWSANHLVFPINKTSTLEMQVPYGIITKITNGHLSINTNVSLTHSKTTLNINSLKLLPTPIVNQGDIVNFVLIDNNNNKLFTASSIHLEFDIEKKLMKMSNIDLIATKTLAKLLKSPHIAGEVIAQLHVYSNLIIPKDAKTSLKSVQAISCATNPIWPPAGEVDVTLLNVSQLTHVGSVTPERIIIAPSASLKNIGTADVAWYWKFSGSFPPYNNDQHPYLNWSIYREIDGRFEQIGLSGIKHAFYTLNTNCSCPGGQVLGLECEDVYGVGNNDSNVDLGPRQELDSFTGIWESCGSFFDPMPCTGSLQNSSTGLGQNRLIADTNELTDPNNSQLFFQAWYVIRDDIDIFNSMGYRTFAPTPNGGGGWSMNEGNVFTNGAALDNYVTPNTISAFESSQTQSTNEGHFTVAVKVIDLGNGMYRYNYAIENYDFDPRFNQFTLLLDDSLLITDWVFSDSDDNTLNDWTFNLSNNQLQVIGDNTNEQDWGMLFSFSFTSTAPPKQGVITIDVASPVLNNSVSSAVLIPDVISLDVLFKSSFEN